MRPKMQGNCLNCGDPLGKRSAKGRCRYCYEYLRRCGQERLAAHRPLEKPAPVWEETRIGFCDCGQRAAWRLTVSIGDSSRTTLLLCDKCAALEKRLAPCHSWAGG